MPRDTSKSPCRRNPAHPGSTSTLPLARHFLSIPFFRRRTISRKPHPGLYNRRQWMPPARLPRLHHPQLIDIPDPHFVRPWSADKEMTFLPNPCPVLPIRAAQPPNQLRRLHARSLAKHVNLAEPLTDRGTIPFCPFLGRTHLQFLRVVPHERPCDCSIHLSLYVPPAPFCSYRLMNTNEQRIYQLDFPAFMSRFLWTFDDIVGSSRPPVIPFRDRNAIPSRIHLPSLPSTTVRFPFTSQ